MQEPEPEPLAEEQKREELRILCSRFYNYANDRWPEYLTSIANVLANDLTK